MMQQRKQLARCAIFVTGFSCVQSHASTIQSITIEEIGVASGGLGTSTNSTLGGEFSIEHLQGLYGFISAGSLDGKILMGRRQGPSAFTPGIAFPEDSPIPDLFPNTLNRAPFGWMTGPPEDPVMQLDFAGWGMWWASFGINLPMPPPAGPSSTSTLRIDDTHYYYTADWLHLTTPAESPQLTGIVTRWHLEGIATVPEPGTIWLVGGTLLGLLGTRYRKLT